MKSHYFEPAHFIFLNRPIQLILQNQNMNLLFKITAVFALIFLLNASASLKPYTCNLGFQGQHWHQDFYVQGGSGNYQLTYTGLPSWVTVDKNSIFGVPTGRGKWPITVEFKDKVTGENGRRKLIINSKQRWSGDDRDLWSLRSNNRLFNVKNKSIIVNPNSIINSCNVGQDLDLSFSALGGSGTYSWQFGQLPQGLISNQNRLYGKPSKSGIYTIRASCADSDGNIGHAFHTLTIEGGLKKEISDQYIAKKLQIVQKDIQISQKQIKAAEAVKNALEQVRADQISAQKASENFEKSHSALEQAQIKAINALKALKLAQQTAQKTTKLLNNAQNILNAAQSKLNIAKNAQKNAQNDITTAQQQVNQAQANVNTAQTALDNAAKTLNEATAAFNTAQNNLKNAKLAYNSAQQNLLNAQLILNKAIQKLNNAIQNEKITAAQLAQAQTQFNNAQKNFNSAKNADDIAQSELAKAIAANKAAQDALAKAKADKAAACLANDKAIQTLKLAKINLYKAQSEKGQVDKQAALLLAEHSKTSIKTRQIYDGPLNLETNCRSYDFPLSYGYEKIVQISNGCFKLSSGRTMHTQKCTQRNREPRIGEFINWEGYYQGSDIWAKKIRC